ncbi:MAG: ATP-grasp domain-containing protein [Gemmatimonadetes bacterium]|nr:MAG: ATP-grasp domain-containing protein [Gemmatimonadota bacterium]
MTPLMIRSNSDLPPLFHDQPPVVFVTNTIHYAVGLDEILPNFHIICGDDDPVRHLLEPPVLSLTHEMGGFDPDFLSTHLILAHHRVRDYLNSLPEPHLIYFKPTAQIEQVVTQNQWHSLMPPAKSSLPLENKLRFFEVAKQLDLPVPGYRIIKLNDRPRFQECLLDTGLPVILQMGFSFAGNGTFFIQSEADFARIQEQIKGKTVRISRYIEGLKLTINACVTRFGTVCSAPFYQITGVPELTANPLGSCGNDWRSTPLPPSSIDEMVRITQNMGNYLATLGYKGIFGLDFVVDSIANQPYLIEINPRLVASIAFYTQLQVIDDDIPMLALHLLEHLNANYQIDLNALQERYLQPKFRSQIIARNVQPTPVQIKNHHKTGIYTGDRRLRDGVGVRDIHAEHESFLMCHASQREFKPASEISRWYFRRSIVDDRGHLRPEILHQHRVYLLTKKASKA